MKNRVIPIIILLFAGLTASAQRSYKGFVEGGYGYLSWDKTGSVYQLSTSHGMLFHRFFVGAVCLHITAERVDDVVLLRVGEVDGNLCRWSIIAHCLCALIEEAHELVVLGIVYPSTRASIEASEFVLFGD